MLHRGSHFWSGYHRVGQKIHHNTFAICRFWAPLSTSLGQSNACRFQSLRASSVPRHPVPVILLARLTVDQSVQAQRLGGFLTTDALRRCLSLAEQLGVHAVEVAVSDEQAKAFSQRYGFTALLDDPLHLFLPMVTVEEAFAEDEAGYVEPGNVRGSARGSVDFLGRTVTRTSLR